MNLPAILQTGGRSSLVLNSTLLAGLCFGLFPARAVAATNTVSSLTDNGPGSLRQVVLAAAPGDTIVFSFASGLATLSQQVVIDKTLVIIGPGTNLVVSGNQSTRLFQVAAGTTVLISGLTLRDGRSPNGVDGTTSPLTGGTPGEPGGAIYNAGTLTITDCVLSHNSAGWGGAGTSDNLHSATRGADGGAGGAIYNTGALAVSNCVFYQNASGSGGAGGTASTYSASGGRGGHGGAICSVGPLNLCNSALLYNQTGSGASTQRETRGAAGGSGGGVWCGAGLSADGSRFLWNSTGKGGDGGADNISAGEGGPGGDGGGLWCGGPLILTNCLVNSNHCASGGIGGNARGFSYVADSGWGGNGGSGCGIYSTNASLLVRCSVLGNYGAAGGAGGNGDSGGSGGAGSSGAGIYAAGDLTLMDSTVSLNCCGNGGEGGSGYASYPFYQGGYGGYGGPGGYGGGIYVRRTLAITNSTISGNHGGDGGPGGSGTASPGGPGSGGWGGGVYSYFDVPGAALVSCSIVSNRTGVSRLGDAGSGGGVSRSGTARFECLNTLIAANLGSDPDVGGDFTSLGHNLIGVTNGSSGFIGPGDRVGSSALPLDPKVAPLADNGGPTPTVALLFSSPARDAGTTAGIPALDQRGVVRPQGSAPDIGAFEYQYTTPAITEAAFQGNNFWLQGCGLPNESYILQVSTNLVEWEDLHTCTGAACGVFDYLDPAPADPEKRFYRLKATGSAGVR